LLDTIKYELTHLKDEFLEKQLSRPHEALRRILKVNGKDLT
jgi:hypothetical protein